MRLHWMDINGQGGLNGLRHISEIANLCNYYSILLVYHSLENDNWIQCANVINKEHKFKYHIAIRTYSISPEYFVMMYKSFNEIQKNRIMFNIVAGDIHNSESSVDNIILGRESLDTVEKRVDYTYIWIKKVLSLLDKCDVPEIVMSGISAKTLDSAAQFADYNLCMMDTYLCNPEMFSRNKNRMVSAALVIRDTYEEAENVVNNIDESHQSRWTIFGTEQQVIEKIKHLESIGVTDLMIRNHRNDDQYNLIHDLAKKNYGVI
jgi:alkanesulfonate monooxygenase SsuD/methylene tetrahydromethanopterin reductase-like flavin-dependent oxidoreductase (luciferase family)